MITRVLFFISLWPASVLFSQETVLITNLSEQLQESSGLLYFNGKLISHNDSGGLSELYEIDSLTGNISRTVQITSATNIDWEDLCKDDEFIYIGDFGNNYGTRNDLKVYKIPISGFLDTNVNTVEAETINFSYCDQTDFTSAQFTTNFDAEAFISLGDSLIIFSKNWGNSRSNIYSLPKTAGTHTAMLIDSINTEGLVACATINNISGNIVLAGYTILLAPFVFQISDYQSGNFSQATQVRNTFTAPAFHSTQIEGIASSGSERYFLTSESGFTGASGLYSLSLTAPLSVNEIEAKGDLLFPNPASDSVNIQLRSSEYVEIYDTNGTFVKSTKSKTISVSGFQQGIYLLVVKTEKGKIKRVLKLSIL